MNDSSSLPSAPGEQVVLEDTEGYRLTLHRSDQRKSILLIGFGGADSGLAYRGFGAVLAEKQGYDFLFVAQAPGTQYQELSLDAFTRSVGPVVEQYQRVIAYGASLGGYAAVYYGGSIDAKIIAASPRNSAHPLISSPRFASLQFRHGEISQNSASSKSPVILLDPRREQDVDFINKVIRPTYPHATYVEVPYGGHRLLVAVREYGRLREFIAGVVEHDYVAEIDLPQQGNHIYYAQRGRELLLAQEWSLAEQHLRESISISPSKAGYANLARVYARTGRKDELSRLERVARKHLSKQWTDQVFPKLWSRVKRESANVTPAADASTED